MQMGFQLFLRLSTKKCVIDMNMTDIFTILNRFQKGTVFMHGTTKKNRGQSEKMSHIFMHGIILIVVFLYNVSGQITFYKCMTRYLRLLQQTGFRKYAYNFLLNISGDK